MDISKRRFIEFLNQRHGNQSTESSEAFMGTPAFADGRAFKLP